MGVCVVVGKDGGGDGKVGKDGRAHIRLAADKGGSPGRWVGR